MVYVHSFISCYVHGLCTPETLILNILMCCVLSTNNDVYIISVPSC